MSDNMNSRSCGILQCDKAFNISVAVRITFIFLSSVFLP